MITQLKRYAIQILLRAEHTQPDTARIAEVSLRTCDESSGARGGAVDDEKERARVHSGDRRRRNLSGPWRKGC